MFYSKSTGGFYGRAIHAPEQIPGDAVEITDEQHRGLLESQTSGMVIVAGPDGMPIAVAAPEPGDAELAAAIRTQRNRLISDCDWTQLPDAPISDTDKSAWVAYRQALRDITAQVGFPGLVDWPVAP